jgi:ribosomal protein S27AE
LLERERIKDRSKETPPQWCNKCSELTIHDTDLKCSKCGAVNAVLQELVRRQS